jgi:hypothetical protein
MQSTGVLDPGCLCSFVASSGKRFGSPDGTPERGFNELNGWVVAWGGPAACGWIGLRSPYVTSVGVPWGTFIAPKWAAYWIDPAATRWSNWAIKFTGRLYVPWERIRIGVWNDEHVYVKLCSIDTGNSWWDFLYPVFRTTSGTCAGAPGEYSIEVGYFEDYGALALVFIIGPDGSNVAYIPTIDGAWYCPDFDWTETIIGHGQGGVCRTSWRFLPASPSVPHFRGTNYTPGSTDGGGTPRP